MSTYSLTSDGQFLFVMDKRIRAKTQRGERKVTRSDVWTVCDDTAIVHSTGEPCYKQMASAPHFWLLTGLAADQEMPGQQHSFQA